MVIDIDDQDLDLLLLIVDILGHLQMLTGKYTGTHVFGEMGLVLPNPKLFVPRSECFMIVSENQIG